MILNFYFDLPCRTSPIWCSRGSPGGWFWNLSKCHLKLDTKGRFKENKEKVEFLSYETWIYILKEDSNYDDWSLNSEYLTFQY